MYFLLIQIITVFCQFGLLLFFSNHQDTDIDYYVQNPDITYVLIRHCIYLKGVVNPKFQRFQDLLQSSRL